MQKQPSTFRFTLRALFFCTAFVGLGLLALKHPSDWVFRIVNLAIVFLFAYSIIAVLVSTGNRRLFWAAFAASAAAIFFTSESVFFQLLPPDWNTRIFLQLNPNGMGVQNPDSAYFLQTLNHLLTITIATVAAYIIPWLVQRGQKPSRD